MRWRPLLWLLVSILCFAGALYFWRLGDKWAAQKSAASAIAPGGAVSSASPLEPSEPLAPVRLLSSAGAQNSFPAPEVSDTVSPTNQFKFRLTNTKKSVGQLARDPAAILLENALFDTAESARIAIPPHLQSTGDPGTYIVQSKGPLDAAFRSTLNQAGAVIVSYIPNNAYLVRASASVAEGLRSAAQTQSVMPYEPYYRFKAPLLGLAVQQKPLPENSVVNLLLFADSRDATVAGLAALGAELVGEDATPFGPMLKVRPPLDSLPALGQLAGVQELELSYERVPANDLSRQRVQVAIDSIVPTNYLLLTGSKVLVNVNDTGVDTNHPDLQGRVFLDKADVAGLGGYDTDGHGTHVAGIIASSGGKSLTVTNAEGSIMPPVDLQFRGMAPAASILSMRLDNPDSYLQQRAASSNAFIQNNGWTYGSRTYDIAASSYDQAVRDALPFVTGSQPLLCVFPAGNGGGGSDQGTGGVSDSIRSPGTAKNVITVGAVEQSRNITNQVWKCDPTGNNCTTNTPWLSMTDSSNQVARFSSRGNVGIGIEGDAGRFKPDMVAPGTFVVSTRSTTWDEAAYYNPTSHVVYPFRDVVMDPGGTFGNPQFIPANAVQMTISILPNQYSAVPFPDLPLYVRRADFPTTNTYDFVRTNFVSMPPDGGASLSPVGDVIYYSTFNFSNQPVSFDVVVDFTVTNDLGNYFEVLSNLNNQCGPFYRFESGTSMAAADVSGVLALMQEYFQQRLGMTNSPALMKALLINGARSLGNQYNLQVNSVENYQGWGLVELTNTIETGLTTNALGTGSMFAVDQSATEALATGQSRTRRFTINYPLARNDPVRITLVWTDPPGNPVAGVKLVNDLDLIVTNLDTGDVFYGNDIAPGADANLAWDTNMVPNIDVINNVENVYLSAPVGTNYSVTVVGRHVNVNALPSHPNDVVQDYALVISSGNGRFSDALTMTGNDPKLAVTTPWVTVVTNSFTSSTDRSGGLMQNQHVGASTPLQGTNQLALPNDANAVLTVGMTNQWHFYLITNQYGFTNAAFMTFLPPDLSVPQMGATNVGSADNASRVEADIDLYVSTDPSLTNLNPAAIDASYKSQTRGGTETIILSNAVPGLYYIGVKSEDQMAAEYSFLGVFTLTPISSADNMGNQLLDWGPTPIPDGTPDHPGIATITLPCMDMLLRRVVVSNTITHELMGDLQGTVMQGAKKNLVVLNNHSPNTAVTNLMYIYDDSDEGDVPGAVHAQGPGSLHDFAGTHSGNIWQFTQVDNAFNHVGTNIHLTIFLEKQQPLTQGLNLTIPPHMCKEEFIEVPLNVTNMTIDIMFKSGSGPLSVQICPLKGGGGCVSNLVTSPGGSVFIDTFSTPPLAAGTYSIKLCNLGDNPLNLYLIARLYYNTAPQSSTSVAYTTPTPLLDDAVTYASLVVTNHLLISSLDVGLLVDHSRISDLAITLISPKGTRALLFEDRGALSTNGLGTFSTLTNGQGVPSLGMTNFQPLYTNDFERAPVGIYAPSTVFQGWTVLSNLVYVVPDLTYLWLSNNALVLGDGVVSNSIPTTNASLCALTYRVNHAPYLVGTVSWWPLDGDGTDIFGGLNGLLSCGVDQTAAGGYHMFANGMVNQAFYGDGSATRMMVPRCPELDLGRKRGFTIEGWINPSSASGSTAGPAVMADGFEGVTPALGVLAGRYINGWLVESGDVDLLSPPGYYPYADTGTNCVDLNGNNPGSISTNITTVPGQTYQLSFAYTKNPAVSDTFVASTVISITGQPDWYLDYSAHNTPTSLNYFRTSRVFTASSSVTKLKLASLNPGNGGMFVDSFTLAPVNSSTNSGTILGTTVFTNGFENMLSEIYYGPLNIAGGWFIEAGGTVEIQTSGHMALPGLPDSGNCFLDINGWNPGVLWTNVTLVPGKSYALTLAYARNPDSLTMFHIVPSADVSLGGVTLMTLAPSMTNSWAYFGWQTTSVVFTATASVSKLQLRALTTGPSGVIFDSIRIQEATAGSGGGGGAAPIAEWSDPAAANGATDGVQFWLSGLPGTNAAGALLANLWDTNSQPHVISTAAGALTNAGWKHVALTYDAATLTARIYVNGNLAVAQPVSTTAFVPRTTGDFYLGFHPNGLNGFVSYKGGLDEFGLYERALSDCEIAAIWRAGALGKYGTNVLTCPVTNEVQLLTSSGNLSVTFTNGYAWMTNGPHWETNTVFFTNLLASATTNGPATNRTGLIVVPHDPNVMVDDFVVSGLVTNFVDGLLHFSEDTNVALVPIKFAPYPYSISNFPPTLIFSNDFEMATQGVYQAMATWPGSTNDPALGPHDWTVAAGPLTVVSNAGFDLAGTNYLALAQGAVSCTLPVIPGQRYQLTYSLRGPAALGWWTGDIDPYSQRAVDAIGGNEGAFIDRATNTTAGFVGPNGFYFNGLDTNGLGSKIELGDPANLRVTNALTIEGWIQPRVQTNYFGTEQILFRGDLRQCLDPYYVALEPTINLGTRNLRFHIDDGVTGNCGVDLYTTNGPVVTGQWQHFAAVFNRGVIATNANSPILTNEMRIYLDGVCIASNYTGVAPFRDLDPAFSPGVTLGNRSRSDYSQPFRGYLDELSIYGRALTDPEIAAIYNAGSLGKYDRSRPPAQSLAKLSVLLDNVQVDTSYGENSQWTTRTVTFTATRTNEVVTFQGLLPGTLFDGFTLTELPAELTYLPEESLSKLNGEFADGTWYLEVWDKRSGATNSAALLDWTMNFVLAPSNPPPVIYLQHGMPYTNTLAGYGVQNFVVEVPQWASRATNFLEFASDRAGVNPLPVGVLWDLTNPAPSAITSALLWPPVSSGSVILTTNPVPPAYLLINQPYYLTVTNPNPQAVTFAFGVWFDITSLTNCVAATNFVGPAGIPRYFQFDVPTNDVPPNLPAREATFWLSGAQTNVTVVLSSHLPLPDLRHYDYISAWPSTNQEILMVLTNSTPWPLQTNRWYVGVYNTAATNVPFTVQACYTTATNYPVLIPLQDGVPYNASLADPFAAPPGPPRWFFFQFRIPNYTPAVLFELYNLSGDADLVLQRDVPPAMAPYYAGSFRLGTFPEQIVLRPTAEMPDLTGTWYLGVYNNETTNIAYAIRASLAANGMLQSGQVFRMDLPLPLPAPHGLLLQWPAIQGEYYKIQTKASLSDPLGWQDFAGPLQATTPIATYEIAVGSAPQAFYRVVHVPTGATLHPALNVRLGPSGFLRISWPITFPNETLQYSYDPTAGPWLNVSQPVVIEGAEFVVYDPIGPQTRYYRIVP